jgi:hypothetical protein
VLQERIVVARQPIPGGGVDILDLLDDEVVQNGTD